MLKGSKTLKISILLLESLRVLSGGRESCLCIGLLKILQFSRYDVFLWFFQKNLHENKINFFSKFEIPNLLLGGCQSNLRGCKFGLQLRMSKSIFKEIRRFLWFFLEIYRKLKLQNNSFKWNSQPCSCVLSKIANIAIKKDCSNFGFFEMWIFSGFQRKYLF